MRLCDLRGEERPTQVGRDDRLPVVVRHLVDEVVADDPRAGDENVETTRLRCRGDGGLDVGTRSHVAADRATADPVRGPVRGGLVEVSDDDMGALGGQPLGRRSADALRPARDERRLAVESAHRSIRATFTVQSVEEVPGGEQGVVLAVIEREGEDKPVCVAELVVRMIR